MNGENKKMNDSVSKILDPGYSLTLRPMQYPQFFERYQASIKNIWRVEEVSFTKDLQQLQTMTKAQRHLVQRLVAFFATGDTIVSNNLVLNLYQHINSPEARMYLSRQLAEEALHIQFYLNLLDNYVPDQKERMEAFQAVENIPSIKHKADFCYKWIDSIQDIKSLETKEDRRQFLLNLICFATCIEGLFFFGAFAYVYYLRSLGLLPGLADGTNWVFRDESCHIDFAMEVVNVVRQQEPDLFDAKMAEQVREMLMEAVDCEVQFSQDVLEHGLTGISVDSMREYLQFRADQHSVRLGMSKIYGSRNPFDFMELQDVQELTNFFERRPSAYQIGLTGEVDFDDDF